MTLESKLADFQKCLDVGPGSPYEEWLHKSLSECLGRLKKCRAQRDKAVRAFLMPHGFEEEDLVEDFEIEDEALIEAIEELELNR